MRPRGAQGERRLTDDQRADLLRHIAAVPNDAGAEHPAVKALVAYRRSLAVPWWAGGGTAYLRVGGMCTSGRSMIAEGLDLMRRLAECDDWGDAPGGWSAR